MAGFIPVDTALTWYINNQQVSVDNRVSVSYRDGSFLSGRGFENLNKSVESSLSFKPPQLTDSGIYECRIIGYEYLPTQTVVLVVEESMSGESKFRANDTIYQYCDINTTCHVIVTCNCLHVLQHHNNYYKLQSLSCFYLLGIRAFQAVCTFHYNFCRFVLASSNHLLVCHSYV